MRKDTDNNNKPVTTEARAEAARRNGAKSKGPITPEGKARSSRNALIHGLCASTQTAGTTLFSPAEQRHFDRHREAFHTRYQPADAVESSLVDDAALYSWLHRRGEHIQIALLDHELDVQAPEIEETYHSINHRDLLAVGFKSLADHSSAFTVMDRHLSRVTRAFSRTINQLEALQTVRRAQQAKNNANLRNEPKEH